MSGPERKKSRRRRCQRSQFQWKVEIGMSRSSNSQSQYAFVRIRIRLRIFLPRVPRRDAGTSSNYLIPASLTNYPGLEAALGARTNPGADGTVDVAEGRSVGTACGRSCLAVSCLNRRPLFRTLRGD